jgi:hypothetical protein
MENGLIGVRQSASPLAPHKAVDLQWRGRKGSERLPCREVARLPRYSAFGVAREQPLGDRTANFNIAALEIPKDSIGIIITLLLVFIKTSAESCFQSTILCIVIVMLAYSSGAHTSLDWSGLMVFNLSLGAKWKDTYAQVTALGVFIAFEEPIYGINPVNRSRLSCNGEFEVLAVFGSIT